MLRATSLDLTAFFLIGNTQGGTLLQSYLPDSRLPIPDSRDTYHLKDGILPFRQFPIASTPN